MAVWDDKTASAGDKSGGVSGVGAAAAVVPGGAAPDDYVGGGAESGDDMDADDMPQTGYGNTDGHADCVPAAGGGWPAIQK